MDVNFDAGILTFWYDSWLVLAGFAVALVLAVLVVASSRWSGPGLLVNTVMVLAVLAGLPMTMTRIAIDTGITDYNPVGFMSLIGSAIALVVGLVYLQRQAFWSRVPSFGVLGRSAAETGGLPGGLTDAGGASVTSAETVADESPSAASAATMLGGRNEPSEVPAAPAPTAWLHFKSGPRAGQSIPLEPGVTSLGRGVENTVIVEDAAVSRNHASIAHEGGQFFLEDTGSMGGTMVDGMQATRTLLSSGATLQLGETQVVFMQSDSVAAGGTEAAGVTGGQGPGETIVSQSPQGVMAWLAVTAGPQKGRSHQLRIGDNTIGRDLDNDLVIEDSSVSRRHAMVKVLDDSFIVTDLGSRTGTKVGGRTLEGRVLKTGGVISLGDTNLNLVEVQPQEGQPQPVSSSSETMVEQPGGEGGGVLIAQSGPDAGKSFPLSAGDNVIGRDPEAAVTLSDDTVSRTHAVVRHDQGRFVVLDLGSRSGTRVDGEEVRGYKLTAGETVSLGSTEVVLMQVETGRGRENDGS